jgi:putative aminopeptidase FrvX
MNTKLLRDLCAVRSPSGEESAMKEFILNYVRQHAGTWVQRPEIVQGPEFQDCLLLRFGKPRVAAIAHMDTTGLCVRYENQLIPIGSPEVENGDVLVGADRQGEVECRAWYDADDRLCHDFGRPVERGTSLVFKPDFRMKGSQLHAPYLDNRAGIAVLLEVAESLENGLLVFSCWEEHGGGSMPYLCRYMYERLGIMRALVSDVTWTTDGIAAGEGVVISLRDRQIPRRSFVRHIVEMAEVSGIAFQAEVEATGSSDGREIQQSPYPIDWCFIGPPCARPHSAAEILDINDLKCAVRMYRLLMEVL